MASRTAKPIPTGREVARLYKQATGESLLSYARQCHVASVKLVQAGVLEGARVARGTTPGVGSQHSWVVVAQDCYDPDAVVVDPTLWSYVPSVQGVWVGQASERPHTPHGAGSIWDWGKPTGTGGRIVELAVDPGDEARVFLELLGPLDHEGWFQLLNAPVGGWPAAAVVDAAYRTEELQAIIPIDRVGMLTDHNPGGLYQ